MPFEKGIRPKHLFSSTNQPKRNGRKPALYKQLTALTGSNKITIELSREDFTHIQQWLLERNKSELERIAKDPKTPIFIMNMITAIGNDVKSGNFGTIERVLERLFGKPKISAEIEGSIKTIQTLDLSGLTDEELEVLGKIAIANRKKEEGPAPNLEIINDRIEITRGK